MSKGDRCLAMYRLITKHKNSRLIGLFAATLVLMVSSVSGDMGDPTAPIVFGTKVTAAPIKKVVAVDYKLTEILIAEDRRLAVINGEIVREGDKLLGGRVLRIYSNKVQIRKKGKNINIKLLAKNIKSELK